MSDPVVREVDSADLPAVVELWKELMDYHRDLDPFFTRSENGHENFLKWVAGELEEGTGALFVAEDSGEICGYIKIGVSNYPPVFMMDKFGMISDIAVAVAHRRKGIGEALIEKAMEWFRTEGLDRIEMRVSSRNSLGLGFWEKMGFEPYLIAMFRDEPRQKDRGI